MQLTFLDYSFFLMSRPVRPLDFAMIAELESAPDLAELRRGAERAFGAYPTSACKISGRAWVADDTPWDLAEVDCSDTELEAVLAERVALPFDLARERGVRQYMVRTPTRQLLLTHMHHALGDGVSLTLWLRAQLTGETSAAELRLKEHADPKYKSAHAFTKPSHQFAHETQGPLSPRRRWIDLRFPTARAKWGALGLSHNDLLCAVLLVSLREWERELPDFERRRRGLWIPANVRKEPRAGFGNGTSRIRVYDRDGDKTSFADIAREVRAQVRWSIRNGEWNVPARASKILGYPRWLAKALLWLYAHRPAADYGTLSFSHVELPGQDPGLFARFSALSSVAPLFGGQSLSVTGIGIGGQTHLTLTWDSSRVRDDDARRFAALIDQNRELAYRSLDDEVPAELRERAVVGAESR